MDYCEYHQSGDQAKILMERIHCGKPLRAIESRKPARVKVEPQLLRHRRAKIRQFRGAADKRPFEEKCSFLKIRTKRLLSVGCGGSCCSGRSVAAGIGAKVFWFFSSEKNAFLKSLFLLMLLSGRH
jgi:hypothetical protein